MLSSYIKIAFRNLRRNPAYTLINVAGLSVGIACVAVILMYVRYELSYDRFNIKADRIYRLTTSVRRGGEMQRLTRTAAPAGPAIAAESPEVLSTARVADPWAPILIGYQDREFREGGVYYADAAILSIFDFPLAQGDTATALKDPGSVVISAAMARKYFGGKNPLGKALQLNRGKSVFLVTGVLQPIPTTSHFRPDFIIPFANLGPQQLTNWLFFSYHTYILLRENVSPEDLQRRFPAFVKRHYADAPADFPEIALELQPLGDIHLGTDGEDPVGTLSPKTYLYLFSALALVILAVACVNFMNLATARSQQRAMEVGVRKVVGGLRSQLVVQFLSESLLLSFTSVLAAIVIVEFSLPLFNELAQKDLVFDLGSNWELAAGCVVLAIIVGVAAGSYPAFVLSRFNPVQVLKGATRSGAHGARLRQLLVVSQFTISIFLVACTWIVNSQIEFIRNKQLGFDKEQVVTVQLLTERQKSDWAALKTELLRHPEIMEVSAASGTPAAPNSLISASERGDTRDQEDVYTFQTDYDFFRTLKIQLMAGRFFAPEFHTDSTQGFILNETAVRKFGWQSAEAAIGQSFIWMGHGADDAKQGVVTGVVRDFHFRPLFEEIAPAVFHLSPEGKNFLLIRVRPNSMNRALDVLKSRWKSFDANHPLQFSFLDEAVEAQYSAEGRLLRIFSIFSALALLISCLGLLGLLSFTIAQRTKEIGIRKVLGASVVDIVLMLSKGSAGLILVAFVIAAPGAWYATTFWLEKFAYHRSVDVSMFLWSGLLVFVVAWLVISFQAIRAAIANPVEGLRYE